MQLGRRLPKPLPTPPSVHTPCTPYIPHRCVAGRNVQQLPIPDVRANRPVCHEGSSGAVQVGQRHHAAVENTAVCGERSAAIFALSLCRLAPVSPRHSRPRQHPSGPAFAECPCRLVESCNRSDQVVHVYTPPCVIAKPAPQQPSKTQNQRRKTCILSSSQPQRRY